MISTDSLERIIAGLEIGERQSMQEAIAILRLLQIKQAVPGLTVAEHAAELEKLPPAAIAMTAACATMQWRLVLEKLQHMRAEAEMVRLLSEERPTLPSPKGAEALELETVPSPAPPPPSETSDG